MQMMKESAKKLLKAQPSTTIEMVRASSSRASGLFSMRAASLIERSSWLHHPHRAHQKLIGGFLLFVVQRGVKRINRALQFVQGVRLPGQGLLARGQALGQRA